MRRPERCELTVLFLLSAGYNFHKIKTAESTQLSVSAHPQHLPSHPREQQTCCGGVVVPRGGGGSDDVQGLRRPERCELTVFVLSGCYNFNKMILNLGASQPSVSTHANACPASLESNRPVVVGLWYRAGAVGWMMREMRRPERCELTVLF